MTHNQTADRWFERIDRATQLLGSRLDDPPALAELASAAGISPFHFHRIWRAMTGETVAQSVLRLRLDAAKTMLADGADVTETSMASGFATSQSFARAFRRQTGRTPTDWRRNGVENPTPKTAGFAVEVVRRDAVTVVALRREGHPYTNLNETFRTLWSWAEQDGRLGDLTGIYGLPLDDPQSVPTAALRYEAALSVGPADPPEPFSTIVLPEGRFARLTHLGSYDGLEEATQALLADWLLVTDEEPDDTPLIYSFLNDPDETPEAELITEIFLPLQHRSPA
jgi:AraC family transcriptional regulator